MTWLGIFGDPSDPMYSRGRTVADVHEDLRRLDVVIDEHYEAIKELRQQQRDLRAEEIDLLEKGDRGQ